jgi:hypothetical protein
VTVSPVTTAVLGRRAGSLRLGPKGTITVPLDGAARGSSRTRAPARGAVAAPPPPVCLSFGCGAERRREGIERKEGEPTGSYPASVSSGAGNRNSAAISGRVLSTALC